MMTRRSWVVYGMLAAIWAMLIVWQIAEHMRARQMFHNMVVEHGGSISTTCGLLMRARSYFGVVSRERLEAALNELVNTHELRSVQLLNSDGQAVASAGVPFELPPRNELEGGVLWSDSTFDHGESGGFGDQCAEIGPAQGNQGGIAVIGNRPRPCCPNQCCHDQRQSSPLALRLARAGPPLLDEG